MTNPTSNFGWQMPTSTDLVTDLPADFEVFGQAVDTSLADLKGGTTGQVLAKNSNTDMDFVWTNGGDITAVTAGTGISGGGTSGDVTITNSMATAITTNGDLIYGTGSGTFTRRGIGTTGQILTVSGGVPTWSTPAGGGKVLQVVAGYTSTATTSSSSTYIDTTLTASITPSATTSKILIFVSQNGLVKSAGNASNGIGLRLLRNTTALQGFAYEQLQTNTTIVNKGSASLGYLDSPNTTSSVTYKTDMANTGSNNASVTANENCGSSIILMEIGA